MATHISTSARQASSNARHEGFGGFPNPIFAIPALIKDRLDRTRTMNRTNTQQSMGRTLTMNGKPTLQRTGTIASGVYGDPQPVNYISFDAVVGRNSHFKSLTAAQEEELGGVEYRALTLLVKIVAGYWLGFQLIAVLMIAPYLSTSRFNYVFNGDGGVDPTWYTFFNIFSAFSNNGMSLLDSSMIPFQATYLWVLVLMTMILAGNTAFPIFLRLIIWTMSKIAPAESRTKETLQFLLDHPRRSFLYLFPSYQTWFLVFVLVVLNCTDWFFFIILDLSNRIITAIALHIRVIDGLFQATAVRAAGFVIVNLADTAPALQVLYVIMMYIAVYPIALSVRTTNVYEERSMGIFGNDGDDDDSEVEAEFNRQQKTGSYIAYHARKQLAFDIWWLVLALFCICIIEKNNIEDHATDAWFNVFTVIFEITSAYGTVGLSLGSPVTGTSLCGSFRTLSKLILVAVMIRGRHRGLPNAIDRAVLLPSDMTAVENNEIGPASGESRSLRRGSTIYRERPNLDALGLSPTKSMAGRNRRRSDQTLKAHPKTAPTEDSEKTAVSSSEAGSSEA